MIFTWKQVFLFFAGVILVGIFIYPSAYFRGQMHKQEGDRQKAITFFQDYLVRHPFHKGATTSLADTFEAAGTPDRAVALMLAFYRHRRGDWETGLSLLDLMDRADMKDQEAEFRWELYDDLKVRPGTDPKLLEELMYQAYQEASANQNDAGEVRALNALMTLGRQSQGYWSDMVRHFTAKHDFAAVASLLEGQLAKDPGNIDLRRTLIRIDRLRGDLPGALVQIDQGLKLTANDPDLLGERIEIHQAQKRFDLVIQDLRLLIRRQPRDPEWPRELGRVLIQTGRLEEGLAIYRGLIKKNPNDKDSWWTVIYSLTDRQKFDEAARMLERYTARFPSDKNGIDMLLYEYESAVEMDKLIPALERYLERYPGDFEHRRTLAYQLEQAGHTDESARQYRIMLARKPDDPTLWLDLASMYEYHHLRAQQAAVLEEYLKRFPNDGKARDLLVNSYLAQGQKQKAISMLQGYFKNGH